jgi:hypothetical protein
MPVDPGAVYQRHTTAAKWASLGFHRFAPCNCSSTAISSVIALATANSPGLDRFWSNAIAWLNLGQRLQTWSKSIAAGLVAS